MTTTVALARRLDGDLRPLGELLEQGRLSRPHVAAVLHGTRGLDTDIVVDAMPAVTAAALSSDPIRLARELRARTEAISPALAEQARRRLDARIGVSCDPSPDGTGHLTGTLHPETTALLNTVLDATVHGRRAEGDQRSISRRRHDALLEVLRHAAGCDRLELPAQGGTRAQVTVVASAATLCDLPGALPARLVGAGLLTRAELLRMLCDADISTVHLSADHERLELSRLTRTVTPAQWRALIARDQHCVVAGPALCVRLT